MDTVPPETLAAACAQTSSRLGEAFAPAASTNAMPSDSAGSGQGGGEDRTTSPGSEPFVFSIETQEQIQ